MVDAKKIEELRGLLAKATPRPWELVPTRSGSSAYIVGVSTNPAIPSPDVIASPMYSDREGLEDGNNMAFIVAMRNALPELLDLAEANLARGGEGEGATDQPKGGDVNAHDDQRSSSSYEKSIRATSPGSKCEPAGASVEELCKRLEAVENSSVLDFGAQDTTCWYRNPDGPEAASLIRRLVRERDCATDNCKAINKAGLKFARERNAALADAAFWKNLQDALQDDCDKYLTRATAAEAEVERLRAENAELKTWKERRQAQDEDEADRREIW